MAAADGNGFRLIAVHEDDDELVVHAGSGASVPAGEPAVEPAVEPAAPAEAPADAAEPATPAEAPAPRNARQEELLRRAEELERAEAGLSDPKAFSGMHRIVLVALIAIVVAFVVYIAFLRG